MVTFQSLKPVIHTELPVDGKLQSIIGYVAKLELFIFQTLVYFYFLFKNSFYCGIVDLTCVSFKCAAKKNKVFQLYTYLLLDSFPM